MPHLLTDKQNRQRVKMAKKLLQMFQTKSSLPMSSQVMKIGFIILSPSESLAIKSGPLNIQNRTEVYLKIPKGINATRIYKHNITQCTNMAVDGVVIKCIEYAINTNILFQWWRRLTFFFFFFFLFFTEDMLWVLKQSQT